MAIAGKRRTIAVGLAVFLIVAAGVGAYAARFASGAAAGPEAAATLDFLPAQVTQVQPRRLAFELILPGTVQAISQATVRSKLSAVVKEIRVREGDAVAAGQVIAEFDTAALDAQRAERAAALASARANLEQAKRTREANAQLVQRDFITQNAFDSADATFQAQAANAAVAEAQLAQTQLQIDDAAVRAPIAGQVARRFVQPGEKVGFDAPLVSIVNLSHLEVQAQAPVADVARVPPGEAADVQIDGLTGEHFHGRVDRINPSADPGSRTIDLYVSFPNERSLVRTGMFANVRLRLAPDREAAALPLTAVQEDGGQTVVWAVRDGRLTRHVVSLGRRDEHAQLVEILGGVGPDERVLATRFDNLKDGGPARIVAGAPTGSRAGAGSAQSAP